MNNRELIENYYRAHRCDVLNFVRGRLHYSDEAEDLVQEAFLRLLSEQRPISEVTLPSLVFTLCRHLIVDWYRRRMVRQDAEHDLVVLHGDANAAESVLSMREFNEQLERGMMRLPEKSRELYRMHIYGGMQAQDISRQTGENYKTVEYRLGQARKQVRSYLQKIS
jgi:RNA polymerase sigma-70 factor (ECF subfamily)